MTWKFNLFDILKTHGIHSSLVKHKKNPHFLHKILWNEIRFLIFLIKMYKLMPLES